MNELVLFGMTCCYEQVLSTNWKLGCFEILKGYQMIFELNVKMVLFGLCFKFMLLRSWDFRFT